MKTFQTLAVMTLVLGLVEISLGDWETSGDDIYTVKGNVGIGTEAKWFARLDVNAPRGRIGIRVVGTPNAMFRLQPNELNVPDFEFWDMEPQAAGLHIQANDDTKLFIKDDGNVGIGTVSPDAKLTLYDGGWNYLLNVGGVGNGKMKVRHIDGKDDDSGDVAGLYLQYGINEHTVMNAGGSTGNVGIGTLNPQAKLDVVGTTATDVLVIRGGADIAEPFSTSDTNEVPKGALVVIDEENPGHLKMSDCPYDKKVAGVVSGAGGLNPGLTLTQKGIVEGGVKVALTGRVYALADASNGSIEPGDLLTTSAVPGYAMKATDRDRSYGAVIGKAMSPLK